VLAKIYAKEPIVEAQRIRRELRHPNRSWRVDEICVRVAGNWTYLYWAVDWAGETIDFILSPKRDLIAATVPAACVIREQWDPATRDPRVINVDGHPAYARPITELKHSGALSRSCRCRPGAASRTEDVVDPVVIYWM
jgi:IS6 family transposase